MNGVRGWLSLSTQVPGQSTAPFDLTGYRPGDVGAEPGAGERDGEGGCGKPGERGASGGHENLQGLVSGRRHQPTGTAWPGRSRREYVR